ncbi:MAG: SDR family oxidoreductase [Ignavibacteria bacterium]|nr:SDR family oxidoreductase [Ignavibacteria bacterium]
MAMELTGYKALVGGASKGIGKASAEALAASGASVTLMARSAETLQQVLEGLDTSVGQKHHALVADVSDLNGLTSAVEKHVEKIGSIHIVVNNTAGPPAGKLVDSDVDSIQQAFNNHILAAHVLMRLLVPGMMVEKFGRFINIISTSVKQPIAGLGVSNTIRGGMASWSKTLATELGPHGITVNNVLPGATETERLASIISKQASTRGKTEQEIVEKMVLDIPVGRFAAAHEIGNAVLFLASPNAGYINGTSILVDGGRTKALS